MTVIDKLFKRARETVSDFRAEVAAVQEKIAQLQEEREAVENMLVPFEDATQSLDRWLDEVEQRGLLPLGGFTSGNSGDWPRFSERTADAYLSSLIAGAMREPIRQYLLDQIADRYEGRVSGTREEKARRLDEIDTQIFQLCVREERLIREAQSFGMEIVRRIGAPAEVMIATDASLEAAA
ncbi:MAG: hypothetical protein RL268_1877 [Pseudomonadota bacterium]|jgi:cell division septum initiation protein DivIVA